MYQKINTNKIGDPDLDWNTPANADDDDLIGFFDVGEGGNFMLSNYLPLIFFEKIDISDKTSQS